MTNAAKDEAELVERIARDLWEVPLGQFPSWNGKSYLADAAIVLAAIRAAGWAVVPVEPTEEMRRATWEAQYRFANSGLANPKQEEVVQAFVQARMNAPRQREQDHLAYAATLAAAPGVKP